MPLKISILGRTARAYVLVQLKQKKSHELQRSQLVDPENQKWNANYRNKISLPKGHTKEKHNEIKQNGTN